jgi:hypothetical protein
MHSILPVILLQTVTLISWELIIKPVIVNPEADRIVFNT